MKPNYEAACLHYKKVLKEACTKRLLNDEELNFLADLDLHLFDYRYLYFTYIYF